MIKGRASCRSPGRISSIALDLVLAALASGFRSTLGVVLEIAAAGRSALAGDLALLAVAHSCESTSFIRHHILLSKSGWDRPVRIDPTRMMPKRFAAPMVGWLAFPGTRPAVTKTV